MATQTMALISLAAPPPTIVSINPLANVAPLPIVHYNSGGIATSYYTTEHGRALLTDIARITGALPTPDDSAWAEGAIEAAVGIIINATKKHPTHRQPVLTCGGSPWIDAGDPLDTSRDAAEVKKFRDLWVRLSDTLAAANKRHGSTVEVGAALLDVESFGWSKSWIGVPGKQRIIDAIGRKHELIYNMTREVLPTAEVIYYDYGASHWVPTSPPAGGCFNLHTTPPPPPGWCMETSFTTNESFARAGEMPLAVSLYSLFEPQLMRDKFARTAATANALRTRAGRSRLTSARNVVPYIALGASYHRNLSHAPNMSAQASEPLPDLPFFDTGNFDFTGAPPSGGYDRAYSMLMGAQANQPSKFGSRGTYAGAFGPWEQVRSVAFFPSLLDARAAPSPLTNGSSVIMDHFVSYCAGAHWEGPGTDGGGGVRLPFPLG